MNSFTTKVSGAWSTGVQAATRFYEQTPAAQAVVRGVKSKFAIAVIFALGAYLVQAKCGLTRRSLFAKAPTAPADGAAPGEVAGVSKWSLLRLPVKFSKTARDGNSWVPRAREVAASIGSIVLAGAAIFTLFRK